MMNVIMMIIINKKMIILSKEKSDLTLALVAVCASQCLGLVFTFIDETLGARYGSAEEAEEQYGRSIWKSRSRI